MAVGNKSLNIWNLQSILWKKCNRRSDSINFDSCIAFQSIGKVYRLAVDKDQINFRMRYATGLDHIFDRSCLVKMTLNSCRVDASPYEKAKPAVKSEPDRERSHIIY